MNIKNLILSILISLVIFSCSNRENTRDTSNSDFSIDTTTLFVTYKNSVFCVPSPQFLNIYLKRLGIYPIKSAVNLTQNAEKYSTSARKAINLGIYGADLGYLNIFSASENTNDYISTIDQLANDLNLDIVFTREVYDQIITLKSNQDSLAHFLSKVFTKVDNYLKDNSQQQTSALIIAGGWIESFYLLCTTYEKYKTIEIKNLIFQQKFVLENLIKCLAPFYDASLELQELIDNLVELAYDFDMLDFKYSYNSPIYKLNKGTIIFNNESKVLNSEESIETITKKAFEIRLKQIS